MAVIGRAKIEKQRLSESKAVDVKRKEALKKLEKKYASADKARTSFGYIGISFLSLLFGVIFLNDLSKFCVYLYQLYREWKQKRAATEQRVKKERQISRGDSIEIELDQDYFDDLEKSLERVHIQLIKATMSNRRNLLP